MPVRSFFSSRSFWKFSIFIMVPWSCSTNSEMSARDAAGKTGRSSDEAHVHPEGAKGGGLDRKSSTSAVPEVIVRGRVVLAQPLQDEFVVQQAVERPEEEDVEGQVANSLLLEVATQSLHLPAGPEDQQ